MKEKIKKIVDPIGEVVKWFVGICFIAAALTSLVYIGDKIKGGGSFVAWGGWGKVFLKALIALAAIPFIIIVVVLISSFLMGSFTSTGKIGRKEKGGNADDDSSDDIG